MNKRETVGGEVPGDAKAAASAFAAPGLLAREAAAGLTLSLVAVPSCVASGVLAYSTLGADFVAGGALAGLGCAIFGGLAATFARRAAFVSTTPTTAVAIVHASFISAFLAATGGDVALAASAAVAAVLLAGLWQILFGLVGIGKIIKYTPHPVLTGFLTGIAFLLLLKQTPVLFGVDSLPALSGALATVVLPRPAATAFGLCLIALMIALDRAFPRLPTPVVGLAAGVLAYHWGLAAMPGLDLGPTIGAFPTGWLPMGLPDGLADLFFQPEINLIALLLVGSLTIALLGTLDTLFGSRVAQSLADIEAPPRRELAGLGLGNLVAAAAGGVALSTSQSLLNASFRAGGRTRLTPIIACLTLLACLILSPQLIEALPIVALTAVIIYLALSSIDPAAFQVLRQAAVGEASVRRRARRNALVFLAVLVATALNYPALGALLGALLACMLFIIDMSQPVVRSRVRADRLFSKRSRSSGHMETLRREGGRTAILRLQGVLFFGNADDLASELRRLERDTDFIILDLKRISDLDASGANVLVSIDRRCRQQGRLLVLADIGKEIQSFIAEADLAQQPDLDTALEWVEERVLTRRRAAPATDVALELRSIDLARGLSEQETGILLDHLQAASYAPGDVLCHEGDAPDLMWILTRGCVSVRLRSGGRDQRIASIAAGATVGEMALLEGKPRSATVVADEDVDAYVMSSEAFDRLLREHPHIGQELLTNIARATAQRLRATTAALRFAEE